MNEIKEFTLYDDDYGKYNRVVREWIREKRASYNEYLPVSVSNQLNTYNSNSGNTEPLEREEAIDHYLNLELRSKTRQFFLNGGGSAQELDDFLRKNWIALKLNNTKTTEA